MTELSSTQAIALPDSTKMLRAMVGIGISCALLIVLTYEVTFPIIEKNKAEALEKAIFKVLPGIVHKKAYYLDQDMNFVPVGDTEASGSIVYAGFDQNQQLAGIAIEASGQGFADILRILYGYDPARQAVIGYYVLESKETPGLGDKIEKDDNFLANFNALDVSLDTDQMVLKNHVVPVKNGTKKNPWEVDGITGATISSRAIGDILGSSTNHWVPLIYKNKELFTISENNE